jgi:hypothetical protein
MILCGECYEKILHLKAYKLSIVQRPALPVEVALSRNYPR